MNNNYNNCYIEINPSEPNVGMYPGTITDLELVAPVRIKDEWVNIVRMNFEVEDGRTLTETILLSTQEGSLLRSLIDAIYSSYDMNRICLSHFVGEYLLAELEVSNFGFLSIVSFKSLLESEDEEL